MTTKYVLALGLFQMGLLTLPVHADFSEGSFEEGSFEEAVQTPDSSDSGASDSFGDGFDEGSFGDDGTPTPAPDPAPQTAEDDGFGEGSFEDAAAVEEREPEPTETESQSESTRNDTIEIDPSIYAFETHDYGVPAQDYLRYSPFHGPTPLELPGGYIVSTQGLVDAYLASTDMIVIDVLGNDYGLPDAFVLPNLATPGDYGDRIQQQASIWLHNVTGGDASYPIIVYCSDPQCWLSYNGALRVLAAGYTNVYWYRGGMRAWEMAGLTVYPTGF